MIRARSPFFYFSFIFVWLATVCLSMHWSFNWDLYATYPDGADVYQTIDRVSPLTLQMAVVFGALLICTAILEFFVWLGWEPRALETFKPGCTVLGVNRDSGKYSEVLVRHHDNSEENYLADQKELVQLHESETMHLWVIGKHVSRVRPLPSGKQSTLKRVTSISMAPDRSWIEAIPTAVMAIALSALLTGAGVRTMVVQDILIASRRHYREYPELSVSTGSSAAMIGLVLLVIGLAIFVVMCVLWKRGWDPKDETPNNNHQGMWI